MGPFQKPAQEPIANIHERMQSIEVILFGLAPEKSECMCFLLAINRMNGP